MKKRIRKHKSHRIFGSALLLAGLITITLGTANGIHVPATLLSSGQGSVISNVPAKKILLPQHIVFSAAPEQTGSKAGLIAFGALMMLLGFGLHALIVLRESDEISVPVRIKQAFKKEPRTSRKQMEVIWIERTIRL